MPALRAPMGLVAADEPLLSEHKGKWGNMPSTDHYKVLGVSPDCEAVVIRAAYKALARVYHADVNGTPEAAIRMREINAAYAILRNPDLRASYDQQREKPAAKPKAEPLRWPKAEPLRRPLRSPPPSIASLKEKAANMADNMIETAENEAVPTLLAIIAGIAIAVGGLGYLHNKFKGAETVAEGTGGPTVLELIPAKQR